MEEIRMSGRIFQNAVLQIKEAADRGADVALFGHTHYKTLRAATAATPALFNPGSLRDTGSYGVITITDGQCSFGWKQVPQDL